MGNKSIYVLDSERIRGSGSAAGLGSVDPSQRKERIRHITRKMNTVATSISFSRHFIAVANIVGQYVTFENTNFRRSWFGDVKGEEEYNCRAVFSKVTANSMHLSRWDKNLLLFTLCAHTFSINIGFV
ncbi:hypothetical protein AVEN_242446-1 [Araneus ventricosus]|uniref:Uncharacterized protein n=1 Tax=Araneus ventricosus TaxID=182803 RepID=A0A4Y2KA48_ARAVE|nr:hypothetical protein AVEN_242446-1 [Araneus ventricosus]